MKVNKPLGILAVLFSILVWGISFVSTKVVLTELPPVTIAFLRQFAALVPLFALCSLKKENLRIERKEILTFIIATFFGIVLYFVFENTGLTMTTASNASMLVATIPIFVLITESAVQRKKIAVPSLICIIASVSGVYFVVFEDGLPDFSSKTFLGNILIFGAMFSWIIYTFVSEKLGKKYSSLKMTTIQTLAGIPLFLPFVSVEIPAWKTPSFEGIINILFLGVFCSALAYVFFLSGIKTLGPVLPSSLLNLIPVVTIFAGAIFLDETISFYQAMGTVLIIGSLTFLSIHKLKSSE
ncbi:MAG TPA: DMT family transporter [Clostridiaceae bacterium]|nr:DMT family transporter [Clostridiaceae bacterium]